MLALTAAGARTLKASIRGRLPPGYLFARQDRRQLRRVKLWWDQTRCSCCRPWRIESELFAPLSSRRVFGLRLYALEWLRLLAPLAPRLRGPLAQDDATPDHFVSSVEIDVACDGARPLLDLLAREGHRAERLSGPAVVFSIDALEPIEITLRGAEENAVTDDDDPACDAEELEARMRAWHGSAFEAFRS